MSTFDRLASALRDAIVSRLGWTSLRPVQEQAGEAILDGDNVVVLAPTAGGKTEAALFPALSALIDDPGEGVGILYVAPIKALLNNQAERLGMYTEMVGLRRFVWHGDATVAEKAAFLREPTELLMTTPESLEVMLASPRVPVSSLFRDLRVVIVDEVHAVAGTDRGAHLLSVVERIAALSQHDVQRIGLSATVGNPEAILAWLSGSSSRARRVIVAPKAAARREVLIEFRPSMPELAGVAARLGRGKKSLFFCQSRALTEAVAERMTGYGTDVYVHHSSVSAEERRRAEAQFHHGTNACILCTSTLELGIDVGDLDRVLQADAPSTVSSFLQRMGRTGRRPGQTANTMFLCEAEEAVLQAAALVELARKGWVESVPTPTRVWPVLVHQLFAMALANGAFRPADAWAVLSRVPDFSGIELREYEALIEHLVSTGFLFRADGLASLGEQAERVYGRKNFMELYAVFSSPVLFNVVSNQGRALGSLDQPFVDRLVEDASCFLLAGQPWLVESIDYKERRVVVASAPSGRKPSWGGYLPQFLGFEICREMRAIVTDDRDLPYLTPAAAEVITSKRAELGDFLRRPEPHVSTTPGLAYWWTFAGGKINATLKAAIDALTDWKVVADNLSLRMEAPSIDDRSVAELLKRLQDDQLWTDTAFWDVVRGRLPPYRLSKFQRALPAFAEREMIEGFLLDLTGACAVAGGAGRSSGELLEL